MADLPAGRRNRLHMYYVYVLKSLSRNYRYVGITADQARRVGQHQRGQERTTAAYRPFKVLLTEPYPTRLEARNREKYLKSGVGKEWIKNNFE